MTGNVKYYVQKLNKLLPKIVEGRQANKMINIYTNLQNLPKGIKYINDNESYFVRNTVEDSIINREIIKTIDKGEYASQDRFIDRLGTAVYIGCLSTSSKILINLCHNTSDVFNCDEMGRNAFEFALYNIKDCNMCFTDGLIYNIPEDIDRNNVRIDNEAVSDF
jgi:hypothetical protein